MVWKVLWTTEKNTFFLVVFPRFPLIFSLFYRIFSDFLPSVWHLWQQKNNIAVGMRAHIHARKRNAPKSLLLFFSLSFSFPSCSSTFTFSFAYCYLHSFLRLCLVLKRCFARWRLHFSVQSKEKSAVFLDFFTLWDDFYPYTSRGNVMMEI